MLQRDFCADRIASRFLHSFLLTNRLLVATAAVVSGSSNSFTMRNVGILGISSLLASLIAAVPLDKRVYVYETITTEVIVTTDVTTTITVPAGGYAQAPATTTSTSVSTSTSANGAQFYDHTSPTPASSPVYSWSSTAPPPASTTSTIQTSSSAYSWSYSAPSPAPTSSSSIPSVYVPPPSTSTPTPPPSSTPAPEYTPQTTSQYAPASSSAPSSSGSYQGECGSGSPCTGDITFFDTSGTLACGDSNVNGENENVVALPWAFMGTASNNNPYCGKTVTISRGDKSTTARVADKCMGCVCYPFT